MWDGDGEYMSGLDDGALEDYSDDEYVPALPKTASGRGLLQMQHLLLR